MSELIITIHRAERDWPATTRRTRVTGYGVGVHSMTSGHWDGLVEFVGRSRVEAAIRRRDIEVREAPATTKRAASKDDFGGEA